MKKEYAVLVFHGFALEQVLRVVDRPPWGFTPSGKATFA